MNEDLLNVMGSFSDTALDCIEKQNEEIEQLQQENQSLKDSIENAIEHINNIGFPDWEDHLQDICVSGKSLLKILKGDK